MAFNRRFDAQYSAIKAAVVGGELGRPEVVNIVSRTARPPSPEFIPSSGGLLAEKGSHFYDLARWICGEDPSEVYTMGSVLIDPGYGQVGEVDTAKILLRTPSGTLCQLDFSWRAAYGQDERIEVHGAGGMICTRQEPTSPVVHQTADGLIHPGKLPGWQERFADTYRAELDALIDLVDGGDDSGVLAGLPDGLAAQRIAEACKRSLNDNRPVSL
jgi:myo-inositol 2-dehydrogenase/D-chiro-inositol 1-dehydrogenase